jgi:hypothetical protein
VRPERRERGGAGRFERPARAQPRGDRAAQQSQVQATLF